MYAGKITLIAADAGSGIRNAGKIYAGAGGVTLSADGQLANSGTVAAQEGGALRLNAGQTDNSGTLYAHGTSSIDSKSSLNNSGRILSTSENRIRSARIDNSGQIDGGRLDIAAPVLDNSGRISQSGSQNLTVDTARLANSGRISLPENNNGSSGNNSGNNGSNNGNNGGGNGNSGNNRPPANNGNGNNGNGGHTLVPAPADGRISVSGRLDNSGTIEAGGRTDLNVHSELANSGRLTLGSLKTAGGRFDNRQGTILARSADISSRHTDNRGGALAAGSLKLDGTRLDNRQGVIRSNTLSDIRLSDGLNNQQGEITTAGSLKLAAGDIASSGGSILAGQDLELTANRLEGSGTLAAGRDTALKLSADFDSSGDIEAGRKLSIESGGSIRNRHRLAGAQALNITARHIDNRAEGKLVSGSNIRSREGDITVQGSNITAGDTIRLDSARDIRLLSAQDSQHQDGKNRNAGVQVGVGVSVGAQTGVYIYAEAAYGKGKNRTDSQTHQNTLLQSDKLQLSSKGNTVLNGAQAHARRIDADVGGTLYIESPQDTVEQESKQSGGGIRAQVALGTAWSVSGNYNQSKASGYSRSVGSQSGLFAGEGGYHITADSVRLKGGAIASAADKDHNELTARSFSFEDIRNESSYSASSMGIGAGYGGSLKGSDGFNQSAFGRASQTAGQNIKQGLNYSPTLPQHESGDSQGYTRSLLSEGNITIGGKKTSARALGIQTDLQNAHRSAEAVPDLQNLLDKQQTIAQSTAAIHSAVGTYRGNRAKAAAEELEKQQADHEGNLKERNDGSYEHYLSLSDAQRQQEMLAHSPAYAQAYQEARSWGVGGSKSRALSAAETLITGALGGQGDLQLAANTLAPYAAAAIGKRFGHGENKNEAAQAIGHFMLGAALA